MTGNFYAILAYVVGLGLLFGYAAALLLAARRTQCPPKEKGVES